MSDPVSHEPKWHSRDAAPSEKDGTGRRLRALTTKPPGVMAGFVEDNWSQKCEKNFNTVATSFGQAKSRASASASS